jgi:transcriptional regulator with XRE-family HTH domain
MNSSETLGERLREERLRLGYNQTDMAALVGASKHAQINWEKGSTSPNAADLGAWSEHGLDIAYVVTGERQIRKAGTQQELGLLQQAIEDVVSGKAGKANATSAEAITARYNELYRLSVKSGNHPALDLSDRERDLLTKYRVASDDDKRLVDRVMGTQTPPPHAQEQGKPATHIVGSGNVIGSENIIGHGNTTNIKRVKKVSKKASE